MPEARFDAGEYGSGTPVQLASGLVLGMKFRFLVVADVQTDVHNGHSVTAEDQQGWADHFEFICRRGLAAMGDTLRIEVIGDGPDASWTGFIDSTLLDRACAPVTGGNLLPSPMRPQQQCGHCQGVNFHLEGCPNGPHPPKLPYNVGSVELGGVVSGVSLGLEKSAPWYRKRPAYWLVFLWGMVGWAFVAWAVAK